MPIETIKTEKRLTISDIAAMAGVSKAAVSGVLNKKSRVGQETEKKILSIIKKYNYVPQDSARALSTKRTYQIGYLVSSQVTLGLANAYFATIQAGVSEACKKHGYQMVVSTYDLSSIKNFLMPDKLRQRSVDALVIAGIVSKDVIEQLKLLDIPYVIIGEKHDEEVLCLRPDMVATYSRILKYFADLGHSVIGFGSSNNVITKNFITAIAAQAVKQIEPVINTYAGADDFEIGVKHAQGWLKDRKYTAFIGNDQICIGFLSVLLKNGVKCPDEISVMACSDTALCKWNFLPLSAASTVLERHGMVAAEVLIDLLNNKKTISEVKKTLADEYKPHDLIIRSTTGKASK